MASTHYSLSDDWVAGNRFTAGAETDILLSNTSGYFMHWLTTDNDTAPVLPVGQGHPMAPTDNRAMTLPAGKRIWFAGTGANCTLES